MIVYFKFKQKEFIIEVQNDITTAFFDGVNVPLTVITYADRVYNLTTKQVIKDLIAGDMRPRTLGEIRACFYNAHCVTLDELILEVEKMYNIQIKTYPPNLCNEISLGEQKECSLPCPEEKDPMFYSGCETCNKELLMSEMYYDPTTGDHTCEKCYDTKRYNQSMRNMDDRS